MEKLNHWLSLIANLGVILGIVFLAVEIQQNTNALRAQTRDSISHRQVEWFTNIGSNQYAAATLQKGSRSTDPLELNDAQSLSFMFLVQSNMRMWENEYYQYKIGLFDDKEFEPRLERWKFITRAPGRREVWQSVRSGYSPDFRALMDEMHGYEPVTD